MAEGIGEDTAAKRRVVIVGGGVSGLTAASVLSKTGKCDVIVLEAEDRIGGRIRTIDYYGETAELGAQWIHGREGNAVYELLTEHLDSSAFEFYDERYEAERNGHVIFTSGRKVSSKALKFFHLARQILAKIDKTIRHSITTKQVSENELKGTSLNDFAAEIWRNDYMTLHDLKSESDAIWNNVAAMMGIVDGAPPHIASCLLYNYYKEIDVDIELSSSFSVFLDLLCKDIPQSSIKLKSKVKTVFWDKSTNSARATFSAKGWTMLHCISQKEDNTHRETRDNGVVGNGSADNLSEQNLTRRNTMDCCPNHHPKSKDTAAKGLHDYAVQVTYSDENGSIRCIDADHVIVTVSLGVLKKYHESLFVPNLSTERQQCIAQMGFGATGKLLLHFKEPFWNDSDFPLYFLWDSELESTNPRSWCKDVDTIEMFNSNTLVVWLNESALENIRALTKAEIWQHLQGFMTIHFNITIPTPDDILMTLWKENENFLGSYSFTAIGETQETRKVVYEPLLVDGIPRILFAGEAFHESRFGTVDGAYLTGVREAQRIVKHIVTS